MNEEFQAVAAPLIVRGYPSMTLCRAARYAVFCAIEAGAPAAGLEAAGVTLTWRGDELSYFRDHAGMLSDAYLRGCFFREWEQTQGLFLPRPAYEAAGGDSGRKLDGAYPFSHGYVEGLFNATLGQLADDKDKVSKTLDAIERLYFGHFFAILDLVADSGDRALIDEASAIIRERIADQRRAHAYLTIEARDVVRSFGVRTGQDDLQRPLPGLQAACVAPRHCAGPGRSLGLRVGALSSAASRAPRIIN